MTEVVLVTIGGQPWARWNELTMEASVKDAARSFTLKGALTLGGSDAVQLFPPAPAVITVGGVPFFTGSVDRYQPKLSGSAVSVSLSGRSKGADAVDSSADHTKGDYAGKTLLQVAQDQDAFGIGFSADFTMTPIDRTRPNIGESAFEFLSSHIDNEMCTMAGQGDGSIKFTRAGANPPRQPGFIIEGINFFDAEADHDWSKRHSAVHVHGQGYKGSGTSATQIHAVQTDASVTRNRPLHIVHPGHTDSARAAKRAENHLDAAAGEGTRLPYHASSWRDSNGALYLPGNKIWVEVPTLSIVQDMLIEKITWRKDAQKGEYADLDLVDPKAHGGQGGKGVNKSGAVWSTP